MGLCSLIAIYGNLLYNNEKILFTIVYAPMALIETLKQLLLLVMVALLYRK